MALLYQEIPTVFTIKTTNSGTSDIPVSIIYDNTSDGEEDITTTIYYKNTSSGTEDSSTEFIVRATSSSTEDSDIEYITEATSSVEEDSTIVSRFYNTNVVTNDTTNGIYLYDSLTDTTSDTTTFYKLKIGTKANESDTDVELTLAEAIYFYFNTSVFAAASGTLYNISNDIRQQTGRITQLPTEVFSTATTCTGIPMEVYCVGTSVSGVQVDLNTASGTLTFLDTDVYNAALDTKDIGCDIKTRSIFISNFFLGVDNYTEASVEGYVDVVDYLYDINESSLYMTKNGVTISGTYIEDITNGKRFHFDPEDDFYSAGEIVLTFHAESVYGEVAEEDYYLLYGYDIALNELNYWEPNQRVFVRAVASNEATCPHTEGIAYYFDIVDYESVNLAASIKAVEAVDISASIYPQSTAFFYGKSYTVTISGVKDYDGNVMEPFSYTFTIEDAPY